MGMPFYEIDRDKSAIITNTTDKMRNFPAHYHKQIEFYYFFGNDSKIEINGEMQYYQKDDIAFIPEFYPHATFDSDSSRHIIIPSYNLTSDISAIMKNKAFEVKLADKEFNRSQIFPVIDQLSKEAKPISELIAKGYLNIIIGKLFLHYPTVSYTPSKEIGVIISVLRYIDEHYKLDLNLSLVAEKFGYSKYYFSKIFNQAVRMSLPDYVSYVRLQKFCALYRFEENISVTELAFSCGFDSLSTFYRAFKEFFGTSPTQYFIKAN